MKSYKYLYLLFLCIFLQGVFELYAQGTKESNLKNYLTGDSFSVHKFENNPLITGETHPDEAAFLDNVNGPSVIRVPKWVKEPLGAYYMYFSHHSGRFIRLAYSETPQGPWKWYDGGVLDFEDVAPYWNRKRGHLASPDVHVDHETEQIIMYYHRTLEKEVEIIGNQGSFVAVSDNGLKFKPTEDLLGHSYFRVFRYQGEWFALAKNKNIGGVLYKGQNSKYIFNSPTEAYYFFEGVRHTAVLPCENEIIVLYSIIGDTPERIRVRSLNVGNYESGDITLGVEFDLISPEFEYEGSTLPITSSVSGAAKHRVHELRDPAILYDEGRIYVYYSIAGEYGIAGAELDVEGSFINSCDSY